jgi:hypothetical protein
MSKCLSCQETVANVRSLEFDQCSRDSNSDSGIDADSDSDSGIGIEEFLKVVWNRNRNRNF